MLKKGIRVYVEGRLQTRTWQAQDGAQKSTTEIVISDMIVLDSRKATDEISVPEDFNQEPKEKVAPKKPAKAKKEEPKEETPEINEDDIPF